MNYFEQIAHLETWQHHPFFDPVFVAPDMQILQGLSRALQHHLHQLADAPLADPPKPVYLPRPESWSLRVIIMNPDYLQQSQNLKFVGFFGQRRQQICPQIMAEINALDAKLVLSFRQIPAILAYCTVYLSQIDNYANLVLLKNLDAARAWRELSIHQHAANIVSPDYYANVRIYNGVLPAGLTDETVLTPLQVKFFDYQDDLIWRASRQLNTEASLA